MPKTETENTNRNPFDCVSDQRHSLNPRIVVPTGMSVLVGRSPVTTLHAPWFPSSDNSIYPEYPALSLVCGTHPATQNESNVQDNSRLECTTFPADRGDDCTRNSN